MSESKRSDQVFQLSLTEIAFTIAFILLLLLGYLVARETMEKNAALAELAKLPPLQAVQASLDATRAQLRAELQRGGIATSDAVVDRLVRDAQVAAERDRLTLRVRDLEAQISALTEVKELAARASADAGHKDAPNRVIQAMALQVEVERAIGAVDGAAQSTPSTQASPPVSTAASAGASRPALESANTIKELPTAAVPKASSPASGGGASKDLTNLSEQASRASPESIRERATRAIHIAAAVDRELKHSEAGGLPQGKEREALRELIQAAERMRAIERSGAGVEAVRKENSDLRGQVANLRNRLEARGGRDYPPCWADEAGRVEFLFAVELRTDVAVVTPAWPERRQSDAERLPGLAAVLANPIPLSSFPAVVKPIFDWSRTRDPECRHYVQLRSTIADAVQSDRARLMVENTFYKVEARR